MKLLKQITALILAISLFVFFDLGIYFFITKRCTNNFGTNLNAKMIEVENYLPFDENSQLVKTNASLKLTDDLPVLDGATALLPVYCGVAQALYPQDSCTFEDGAFTADSKVQYRNTGGAYKAVVDGKADIIFCAAPSKEQLDYAKTKGAELKLVPIGNEAFVFLVNSKNPIESLTVDQIRKIYSGEYSNWSEVGGANRPIHPLQRVEGSGSQTAMLSFMNGTRMKANPLGFLGGSIGFSFRYYVEGIVKNSNVKMIAVNGVYPSEESIKSGSYPITSNFYAVYRTDNPNENINAVINWLLSPEGQKLISDSGYVGLK